MMEVETERDERGVAAIVEKIRTEGWGKADGNEQDDAELEPAAAGKLARRNREGEDGDGQGAEEEELYVAAPLVVEQPWCARATACPCHSSIEAAVHLELCSWRGGAAVAGCPTTRPWRPRSGCWPSPRLLALSA
jgi:hypothetical protein